MKKERVCKCNQILGEQKLYVHLMGCPKEYHSKEWELLPFWKRLFRTSPEKIYAYWFKV